VRASIGRSVDHGEPAEAPSVGYWCPAAGVRADADPALRVVVGAGGGGGAELQCRLQLRRLHHGHGQPVHQRQAVADHLHAAPLRRDLLRHADVPLLRRPRRRRLPQCVTFHPNPTAPNGIQFIDPDVLCCAQC
jgi:hypothetical protein